MYLAPLPAQGDDPAVVHALTRHLLLHLRMRNCRLLQRHFRYVNLRTSSITEITLSLMTIALEAILGP